MINGRKQAAAKFSTSDPTSTTSLKQPQRKHTRIVADFGTRGSESYTMTEREQLVIDILGTIMRDNQHITYDLIRIERKVTETKTDLLKR